MATISFHTIGCRLNQYETAVLRNSFLKDGFQVVPADHPADIVVVNTCTVTEKSDTDTRRFVFRVARLNPHVRIALVGCQAQLQSDILKELPHVRWVIGNKRKLNLSALIRDHLNDSKPFVCVQEGGRMHAFKHEAFGIDTEHTRANLKIQDGCDQFCTYCDVPYARGRAQSRDFSEIIREARVLGAAGHKEIVLTGINTGRYHFQTKTLLDVVVALEQIPTIRRIRISSIEPAPVVREIVRHMTGKTKLCRHLHLPIQHGHDEILTRMSRRHSAEEVRHMMTEAFDLVPGICIGTDIIVGFPGETEGHFEETFNLLRILPVNYIHVFSFSRRNRAAAKDFEGQIPAAVIGRRSKRLRALSERKRRQFYERMVGGVFSVLFEQMKGEWWHGLTDHFIQVKVRSAKPLHNIIRRVRLTGLDGAAAVGEFLTETD